MVVRMVEASPWLGVGGGIVILTVWDDGQVPSFPRRRSRSCCRQTDEHALTRGLIHCGMED